MSPCLFAVYIDDVIEHVKCQNVGCLFRMVNTSIILYADDILLLAPSVHALQVLLLACESQLSLLDLQINAKKSVCVRIGPRCHADCCHITMSDGREIVWSNTVRYLGIFIKCSRKFSCSFDSAKKSFYRSFNAVFGKTGRQASEEVVLHLIVHKCLPCMLYGTDVCPVNRTELRALEFPVTRVLMKLFKTKSKDIVTECQRYFGVQTVPEIIVNRKLSFLDKFAAAQGDNTVCGLFSEVARREMSAVAQIV